MRSAYTVNKKNYCKPTQRLIINISNLIDIYK